MATKYGKKASEKVARALHEEKHGELQSGGSGKTVTSRKQAIAIGLSEARKAGAKVPPNPNRPKARLTMAKPSNSTAGANKPRAKAGTPRATVARQRAIQREQDQRDRAKPAKPKKSRAAVQAGHHAQPVSPLPAQHLRKPGLEADMALAPRFRAPTYRGSGKLAGMVALITGGDSGIGRSVAVLMAREGAKVAIVYLAEHTDAKATKKHVENEASECLLIPGDVRDFKFCQKAVKQTVKAFGRLDILVNNAAFQEHADSLLDLSEARFDETMKTNIYGYFHMAKAALPHLSEGSSIINTGSVTGLEGSKALLDYSATKGAIHAFTKSLASNLLPQGIRVNAVAPGPVWTPLNPADKRRKDAAKFGADTDMHRPAQPEEIAPAFVFLAAPCCASYISGIVLPITGSVGE